MRYTAHLNSSAPTEQQDSTKQQVWAPHKARLLDPAKSERGGGARRPGVGSPRRTRALARCTQQESTVYQRRVSSDGSSSKNSAFIRANFLMKLTVSFAMKPCLSNARAREWVQPAPRITIKNRMLCVLAPSLELCYFSSFFLAALVSSRIG